VAAARPGRAPRPEQSTFWGWHPLRPEWALRLVDSSPVGPGDVVVDLGAGEGALTRPLAQAGCRVLAVELHPRRAASLREQYAGSRVAVLELDVGQFRWPGHPFRVVANPPYAGINALVRRLLAAPALRSADLVVAEGAARGLLRRHDQLRRGPRVPRHGFRNDAPGDGLVLMIRR
jgi:23S rRNA (adenine-N6)-dimethyltransferase